MDTVTSRACFRTTTASAVLLAALLLAAPAAPAQPAGAAPVVVAGTVPDEATRAAILGRLHALYGAARVVDRIEVDGVVAPANWSARVAAMLDPAITGVSGGELAIEGNSVRIRGNVANEAVRQQVASTLATAAGPGYQVRNGLLATGGGSQAVLDQAVR